MYHISLITLNRWLENCQLQEKDKIIIDMLLGENRLLKRND